MEERPALLAFNEWLKRRRKACDLTQDELARRAGCSVGAMRKIESGERRPSKQLARLLAEALEIPKENYDTFVRLARGELNLERLERLSTEIPAALPGVAIIQPAQPPVYPGNPPGFPSNRLPLQATALIGREAEISALERLFSDPQCRLLTLTGMGGIGKTRLAIEYGLRNSSLFPGGVFYIPLAPVNSPEKIVPAVADGFDFAFSGPVDPRQQLLVYLSDLFHQQALIIFDNLEHLLQRGAMGKDVFGAQDLVSEILLCVPSVKILATSRERLNLHGEWTYELHGLSVPPQNFPGQLEDYNSAALFIQSARRVKADFHLTADQQPSIIHICQLVDGVPLAIELAAAWVGVLSCQEIDQEIQRNIDFLTTAMRDIPERHRSIRATFDHSWRLLLEEEREALRQLAVFQGGFDRMAAQMVAGASLGVLASLCAKSLVRRTESGRYDLHEVIRQYALSHLREGPGQYSARERHSGYYLSILHDHEKSLKSSAQQEALRQLTDEIDNILAAWECAIDQRRYDLLEIDGRAFGWYFEITGLYREGIEQFEPLVLALRALPEGEGYPRLLALSLTHQALLYFRKGEFERAQQLYSESIALLRSIDDRSLLVDALTFSGIILHLSGEYELSAGYMQEGLVLARETGQRWYEAYAVYNLGYIASLRGDYFDGYNQMMDALMIWREIGDPHSIALGLNFLVPTLASLSRYAEAEACMLESIALCEQAKNRWGGGTAYRYLGLAYIAQGRYAEAQANLAKSLDIFGEAIIGWDVARTLAYLGDALRLSGLPDRARATYLDALRLSIDVKSVPITLDVLTGLAYLNAEAGETALAHLLCSYILDHPASEDNTRCHAIALRASLELKMNPAQVDSTNARAQGKSIDWIVSQAQQGG